MASKRCGARSLAYLASGVGLGRLYELVDEVITDGVGPDEHEHAEEEASAEDSQYYPEPAAAAAWFGKGPWVGHPPLGRAGGKLGWGSDG